MKELNEFWTTPSMDQVVMAGLQWSTMIGFFLASSFLALKLGWEYFKYSLSSLQGNNVDVLWDWQEISRVFVLIILIGSYTPIASGVVKAIREINEITQPGSEMNEKLKKIANLHYVRSKHPKEYEYLMSLKRQKEAAQQSGDSQTAQALKSQEDRARTDLYADAKTNGTGDGGLHTKTEVEEGEDSNIFNPAAAIENAIIGLTSVLANISKWIIAIFTKMIFKIGIVLGPIVLAFGIFWKEKPVNFLNQMLVLGFVFTTLNILDMCFMYYMQEFVTDGTSFGETIAVNLGMIGCYLSAVKLTSMFVGSVGLNSIMNKGMSGAGMMLGGVVGGAAMASKMASGGNKGGGGSSGGAGIASSITSGANQVSRATQEKAD